MEGDGSNWKQSQLLSPSGGFPQRMDKVPAITSRIPGPAPASVVLSQWMLAGKDSGRLTALDSSGFTTVHSSLRKAPSSKRVWQLCAHRRCAMEHRRPQAASHGGAGETAIQVSQTHLGAAAVTLFLLFSFFFVVVVVF